MKKMVLALAAALTLSMGAMAQETEKKDGQREQRLIDQNEMVQRRTNATVERYGLNEEQAEKLLELNKKYAGKIMPRGRNGRPGMGGRGPRVQRDSMPRRDNVRPVRRDSTQQRRFGQEPEEIRKAMEDYDTELKAILTEEQYKAYKEDSEKRQRPRGDRRPRR